MATLALAGQMLARRSQMVLEGMQPAERITSGRAYGQVAWPVSPPDSHPLGADTRHLEAAACSKGWASSLSVPQWLPRKLQLLLKAYSLSWPVSSNFSDAPPSFL